MSQTTQRGAVNTWLILTIVFIITTIAASGFLVWALLNYFDQKDNVDTKVAVAVSTAKKEQADVDAARYLEEDKKPYREFVGPDDFGRLVFSYPKFWSAYVEDDATNSNTFKAYINPVAVPPLSQTTQVAVRVLIESRDYETVINSYQPYVRRGDLTSSAVKADGQDGTRLDGAFTKDIRGSAVIFKIRDKTVTIRTDAEAFKGDFDTLIKTITFNK